MNWEKSKTIIIILLVALNIYLFLISSMFETSYEIKGAQEKSIIELLNKNGIGIYDEINIEFKPLAPLNILASNDDVNEVNYLDLFFEDPEVMRKDDKLIAKEESKTMIFENGFIMFSANEEEDFVFYGDDIEKYVKNIDDIYEQFVLDRTYTEDGYTYYEFRDEFRDRVVYTNYISFKTKDNKIASITGFYGETVGTSDKAREIASIDMILYTFMEEAKVIYAGKQIFITSVDLVYYQEEYVVNGMTKAIPCYRIYSEGEPVPFIISAYENNVIN